MENPWWKRIVAALPDFFLAVQFLIAAAAGKALLATPQWLTAVMQVELLVIHSIGVVGAFLLYKPASAWRAAGRVLVLCGLLARYTWTAYTWGFDRIAVFFSAAFATYLGVLLNWGSRSALEQLGMRWIVSMVIYWISIQVFSLPEAVKDWNGVPAVLWAGACYFAVLGAIELSGFYARMPKRRLPLPGEPKAG